MKQKTRFSIFPIIHQDLWEKYKTVEAQFWRADDGNYDDDKFEELHESQKKYLKMLLCFFAVSDSVVADNLALNFLQEEQVPDEAKFFYGYQLANENIHCVTKETKILTKNGYFEIGDLVDTETEVWNGIEFSTVIIKNTGVQKIYKVRLSDGTIIRCTDGHKWFLRVGNQKHPETCKKVLQETKNLKVNDVIYNFDLPIIDSNDPDFFQNPYIHGFFCGDGTYTNNYPSITLYGEKKKLYKYINVNEIDNENKYKFYLTNKINKTKYYVPLNYSLKTKLDWLSGLFDADACVKLNSKKTATSIQYVSINKEFIDQVKLLLTTLGVKTNLKKINKKNKSYLPDGKGGYKYYDTKDAYCLYITTVDVKKLIDLGLNTKRLKLVSDSSIVEKRKLIKVVSIEDENILEPTFCFNEPKEHAGVFNGILTGQSETYSRLIDAYIKDDVEKEKAFNATTEMPTVAKKMNWAYQWITNGTFEEKIVAFACVEGILFSSTFAGIFGFKDMKKHLPGLYWANTEISRDEASHYDFATYYYMNYVENKLTNDRLLELVLSAYNVEKQFIEDCFIYNPIGFSKDKMIQYIQYVTDTILIRFGLEEYFNVNQPFKYMEQIAIPRRANFFEGRVAEYSSVSNTNVTIDLNSDF